MNEKYTDIKAKYDDLVRSSEANTRLLLEAEQKNEELSKTVERLSGVSDELLMENIYGWIKVHGGSIDIREFSKANNTTPARTEEGLNLLIKEGYIKRRSD
jgi:transcriptional regulator of NAD metabolism